MALQGIDVNGDIAGAMQSEAGSQKDKEDDSDRNVEGNVVVREIAGDILSDASHKVNAAADLGPIDFQSDTPANSGDSTTKDNTTKDNTTRDNTTRDDTTWENNNVQSDSKLESASLQNMSSDDDDYMDEEDENSEGISGAESDIEDNVELMYPMRRRESNPDLPDTVTALTTPEGSKVYVVGTAHFSIESQEDVSKVIRATQPDFVMVELCKSRINILELDESTLLEEAKNINMEKIRMAIKQSGVVQGVMHLLLLSMSAHLTKELGMAPGGEFRRAFHEARRVPGCRLQLGDRPIQITLKRALAALSVWQKLRLAWYLLTSKDPISKEDVEKCKQRDMLEQMLREMTGEFPALSRVFVEERDLYLAHSLKMAARSMDFSQEPRNVIQPVVVGVVGIGHVPGIVANWDKDNNIHDILIIPEASIFGRVFKWSFRATFLGVLSYGCYRIYRWTSHMLD